MEVGNHVRHNYCSFCNNPFLQTTSEVNYQPVKPDVTCSDLGNALCSGFPPALLHQGEAAGEVSIPCCCASHPSVGRGWGRRQKEYVGKIHFSWLWWCEGWEDDRRYWKNFFVLSSHSEVPFLSRQAALPADKKIYSPAVRWGVLFVSCEAVVTPSFPILSVMQAVRMKFRTSRCCSHSVCVEKLED